MSVTLMLVIFGGAALWVLFETLGKRPDEGAEAAPARAGLPPTPTARIVILPGMRLIDLRGFPREDLRLGNIDIAREQIQLEAVLPVQIWVIDAETVDGWLALENIALVIIAGRLRDRRDPLGKNFLHVIGRELDAAACKRFEEAGIEVALSMTNLGDPPRELADFLEAPTPWAPSPDDRPISPSTVLIVDPLDGELVHVVGDFAFADLRRASPGALGNGVALEKLEGALAKLTARPAPQVMVWVFAPWTLDALPADAAARLRAMLRLVTPTIGHRLAVVAAGGQEVKGHPVTTALLEAGAAGLQEAYYLRTKDRGAFQVPPITALQDTYFYQAWRHPRL